MLKTGELRHRIVKDHLQKDLNLGSIDFDQKYKIQDILQNKGDGKIVFKSIRHSDRKPKQQVIQSVKSPVAIYKQATGSTKHQTLTQQSTKCPSSPNKVARLSLSLHKKETAASF